MADSFSSRLRQRLQQTGGNRNTWGGQLNSAALQLLEDAICGQADVTVAGTDVTLSTANGANDQARMMLISLEGAPGASRNIIVPAVSKTYIVINNTGFTQTLKTSAGTGVVVPIGARQFLMCDGDDVFSVQATSLGTVANADALGGFTASAYARKNAFSQFTAGLAISFVPLTDGGTVTVDCSLSNNFFLPIGGNRTLSINNASDGQPLEIWIKQDATGGRTLAFPANVEFEIGSPTGLSGVATEIDVVYLTYNAAQDLWRGRIGGIGSPVTTSLALTSNSQDLDIYAMAGRPSGAVTVNVTVSAGVRITASSTTTPAMDFAGFDSGSIINLINHGSIRGKGGEGGYGGTGAANGSADYSWGGSPAEAGGPAIRGPGTGRTFNITNADGEIWGGGGGGGGGGGTLDNGANAWNGGGGGGGAGGGRGGRGGQLLYQESTTLNRGANGTNGSLADSGANGTGGAGTLAGTADGGDGGDGGDWGAAGAAGESPTSGTEFDASGGTAGAAGLAINQNGGAASFVSGSGAPATKGAVT